MKLKATIATMVAGTLLCACGGGGGANPENANAQGLWSLNTTNMLVEPTGEFWAVTDTQNINGVILMHGNLEVSGTSVTATGQSYVGGLAQPTTFSGDVVPKTLLTVNVNGQKLPLSYQKIYDQTASLANLAGDYGNGLSGTITMQANGAFAGSNGGCALSGTMKPDGSGKNFYRITAALGAAPCPFPNKTGGGVLIDLGAGHVAAATLFDTAGMTLVLNKR